MASTDTTRGRHRLVEAAPRPSLLPRSAAVITATVGAVLVIGVDQPVSVPAPRPHPTAPAPAFEPVIPVPRDGRPAAYDPVPAGLTGHAIAGAHATGSASVRALDAVATTQPTHGVSPADLFAT